MTLLLCLTVTIARKIRGVRITVKFNSFALRFGCDLDAKSTICQVRTHDSPRVLILISFQNRVGLHRNVDLNFIAIPRTKRTLAHET